MKTSPLTPSPAMRPGNRKPPMNWLMLFVLAVVILGILLLVTDEFGTALIPLDALNTAAI